MKLRALIAVTASAAVLAVTGCSHAPAAHPVTAAISVSGKYTRPAPGVRLPASALQVATPVAATWRITPSGKLPRPAVVTIPLHHAEPNDGLTTVLSAESPNGPWTPVKTKIIHVHGRWYAQATVTHLSWFTAARVDADKILSVLHDFFTSLTSNVSSHAAPPGCGGTGPQARTAGYSIASASGSTMYWCFGEQNGSRVLKVVNNRRYPLLLLHGMPVAGGDGSGDLFQRAAELLSTSGVVAWPQSEIDFGATIQPGHWAGINADLSDEGQLLYSLDVGVQALFTILSHFGFSDLPSTQLTAVNDMLGLDACRAALGNIGAILASCLQSDVIAKVVGFGWSWLLGSIAAITAVWNYFHAALNGLADQFDGRSRYWITVKHTTQATPYSAYLGRWYTHDEELCIGQALDLTPVTATSNPPCSGNSTSGWARMWGCGYPAGGCGFAWIPLAFAYHPDGTVTATPSAAPITVPRPAGGSFYDDALTICTLNTTGRTVPCNAGVTGIPPEGLTPGSQQLSSVTNGVLKVTLPQGYWGGASYQLCGQSASQAEQQHYCPNG